MPQKPIFSVLMSVYNGNGYLLPAVESILKQTFRDFEFIIINDGSTDESSIVLRKLARDDLRIRLFEQSNQGLISSLNRGLELAQGDFVVRMDADDISREDRLQVVYDYLNAYPEVDILGTGIYCFESENKGFVWVPDWCKHDEIRAQLLFRNCIAHPTVVLRRRRFEEMKLRYAQSYIHAEDFELWERASHELHLSNIVNVTVERRVHNDSVTSKHRDQMRTTCQKVRQRALKRQGWDLSCAQIAVHEAIAESNQEAVSVATATQWLEMLNKKNLITRGYPPEIMKKVLSKELRQMVEWSAGHSISGLFKVLSSTLFSSSCWNIKSCVRLLAKSCYGRLGNILQIKR